MSQLFLTEETLESDIYYSVLQYRYLWGSCGYFYQIMIRKVNEYANTVMFVREGILYDYLEKKRAENNNRKFSFKKSNIAMSSTESIEYIIIAGYNDMILQDS